MWYHSLAKTSPLNSCATKETVLHQGNNKTTSSTHTTQILPEIQVQANCKLVSRYTGKTSTEIEINSQKKTATPSKLKDEN